MTNGGFRYEAGVEGKEFLEEVPRVTPRVVPVRAMPVAEGATQCPAGIPVNVMLPGREQPSNEHDDVLPCI